MKNKFFSLFKDIIKSNKKIVVFTISLIFIVIISAFYNFHVFRNHIIAKEQDQLALIAKTTADRLEDFFIEKKEDSKILTQSISEEHYNNGFNEKSKKEVINQVNNYLKIQNKKIEIVQLYANDQNKTLLYESFNEDSKRKYLSSNYLKKENFTKDKLLPQIGDLYYSNNIAFIDITTPILNDNNTLGYLRLIINLEDVYDLLIKDIRIGSKGYASVKSSKGVLVMHPKSEDIGTHVMTARKTEFPNYDWTELEEIVKKQRKPVSGTGIYHSIWYHDEKMERVKKFSAYGPAFIGDDFWMITTSMDFEEFSKSSRKYFILSLIIAGILPVVFIIILLYVINLRKNIENLKNKQRYLDKLNQLNKELEEDIEARKKLEKKLVTSENRFKKLFNAGTDLTFVITFESSKKSFKIVEINNIACKKLKYNRDQLVGKDYIDIDKNLTIVKLKKYIDTLKDKKLNILETKLIDKNNNEFPVEISGQIFNLQNKDMVMLVARDVSEKKKREKQLKKNRALLIYRSRLAALGEMIANIAHQWRQPLGSLSLIITNLNDAYQYNELEKGYFNNTITRMKDIINQMSIVIDDFRHFFSPMNEKEVFKPSKPIENSISMVNDRIKINQIKMEFVNNYDCEIYGYSNQFSQAILNIINNSIDALVDKDGEKELKIIIEKSKKNNLKISIFNNGPLLPKGIEEKIFDPYFTTKKKKGGTGIGLYMTKMIIETNFEGEIKMENASNGVKTELKIPIYEE